MHSFNPLRQQQRYKAVDYFSKLHVSSISRLETSVQKNVGNCFAVLAVLNRLFTTKYLHCTIDQCFARIFTQLKLH